MRVHVTESDKRAGTRRCRTTCALALAIGRAAGGLAFVCYGWPGGAYVVVREFGGRVWQADLPEKAAGWIEEWDYGGDPATFSFTLLTPRKQPCDSSAISARSSPPAN